MSLTTTTNDDSALIEVLSNSLYPGAKPESIALVLAYCRANKIDPMLKAVHIVGMSVKISRDRYEWRDVLMPGIADYRIKAARSGEYAGKSEPVFGPDKQGYGITYPEWCMLTVFRIVDGQARPFPAKERWSENFAQAGKNDPNPNYMWAKRPYGQLAKCAEAQALRMAFPELSGGYTAEEMEGKTFDGPTIDAPPAALEPVTWAGIAETLPPPKRQPAGITPASLIAAVEAAETAAELEALETATVNVQARERMRQARPDLADKVDAAFAAAWARCGSQLGDQGDEPEEQPMADPAPELDPQERDVLAEIATINRLRVPEQIEKRMMLPVNVAMREALPREMALRILDAAKSRTAELRMNA